MLLARAGIALSDSPRPPFEALPSNVAETPNAFPSQPVPAMNRRIVTVSTLGLAAAFAALLPTGLQALSDAELEALLAEEEAAEDDLGLIDLFADDTFPAKPESSQPAADTKSAAATESESGSSGARLTEAQIEAILLESEAALEDELGVPAKQPVFIPSATLTFTTGYRENVTQSAFESLDSTLIGGTAEAFVATDPTRAWSGYILALYERTRFVDLDTIDDEVVAVLSGAIQRNLSPRDTIGIQAEYIYFDQFADISESIVETAATRFEVAETKVGIFWKHDVSIRYEREWGLTASEVDIFDSEDDLQSVAIGLENAWSYGPGQDSGIEVNTRLAFRDYTTRTGRERDGTPVAGGTAREWRWVAEVDIEHHLSRESPLYLIFEPRFTWNRQTPGSYGNYLDFRFDAGMGFARGNVTSELLLDSTWRRFSGRDYGSASPGAATWRRSLEVSWQTQYRLNADWTLELALRAEDADADFNPDSYETKSATLSASWGF